MARSKIAFAVFTLACAMAATAATPVYDAEVVHTYPHDASAFTEGLFYLNGYLYESTGLEQHSTIRKVRLETGEVVQKLDIPPQYFGEGIVNWRSHLISLTWKSQVGFVFDLATFKLQRQFQYEGEGWALTRNDKEIIMSDGTPELRFLDPKTLKETRRVTVTLDGKALANVNELEWVKGEIFANVSDQLDRAHRSEYRPGGGRHQLCGAPQSRRYRRGTNGCPEWDCVRLEERPPVRYGKKLAEIIRNSLARTLGRPVTKFT